MGLTMPKLRVPLTFKSWQVKDEGGDENSSNRWTNRDCIPVPVEQRVYTSWAFTGYWAAAGINATAWSLGSSNIANGLSAAEAIGGVLVGSFIAGIVAFLCGEPGVLYHLGFPMMSRSTFGMYGSYFVITLKCFVNFTFCGIQAYWGGLAVTVFLGSIFPSFQHMTNTLPASALITSNELVGLIIYIVVFVPLLFVHPSKLERFLMGSSFVVVATITGLFAWAVGTNGGASNLIVSTKVLSASERSFRMLQAVSAVAGSWTGSSIRQSDWTRYAKTKRSPVINQLVGAPVTITVTAIFGVFATSAVNEHYGVTVWQPIQLLQWILKTHYTPAARAGCFFAGLGFFSSQIAVNIAQNSVSAGMDLSAMLPMWLDVTRGSLMMIVVGVLINPWRFVNSPGTFITVLSSFGLFISPLAGINTADFWLIRRLRWSVPDLYIGDKRSIYWYTAGFNWRAFTAWTLSMCWSLPGFSAATAGTKVNLGWVHVFQVTWFVGFLGGGFIYYMICLISPPPGKPYMKYVTNNDAIEGQNSGISDTGSNEDIKSPFKVDTKDDVA